MRARVLTALILIPFVLGVLMSASPVPLACLAAVLVGISYNELCRLGGQERASVPIGPAALLLLVGVPSVLNPGWMPLATLLGFTLFGLLTASLWVQKRSKLFREAGSLWFIGPIIALLVLHRLYSPGGWGWFPATPVLMALLPLWVGDTLAYLVGKRFGKRLLAPAISPKKTVEGGIANVAGSLLGGLAVGAVLGTPALVGLSCGLAVGILGQVGDLFESALKRKAGLKDSGTLLPGHGGLLDRIDSLLLSAPAVALLLALAWPPHSR